MPKQTDFIDTIRAAQKRVADCKERVAETKHLYEQTVKNKMVRAAERLKTTLKRQELALSYAEAELKEWETQA